MTVKTTKRASYGEVFKLPIATAVFVKYLDKINSTGGEFPSNKYEITVAFTTGTDLKPLIAKIMEVARVHFKNPKLKYSELAKSPLTDGNERDTEKFPIYADAFILSTRRRPEAGMPKLYDRYLVDGKPVSVPTNMIYSGCKVYIYGSIGAAKINGVDTVWVDLLSVQFAADGNRLGNNSEEVANDIMISSSSEQADVDDVLGMTDDFDDEDTIVTSAPKSTTKAKAGKAAALDLDEEEEEEELPVAPVKGKKKAVSAVSLLDAI